MIFQGCGVTLEGLKVNLNSHATDNLLSAQVVHWSNLPEGSLNQIAAQPGKRQFISLFDADQTISKLTQRPEIHFLLFDVF
jgi:hypothetical protein